MNKPSRLTVIIIGACAVIWTIRAILEITLQTNSDWFALNILCAVIWIAAFVVNLKKYRSNNEEQ